MVSPNNCNTQQLALRDEQTEQLNEKQLSTKQRQFAYSGQLGQPIRFKEATDSIGGRASHSDQKTSLVRSHITENRVSNGLEADVGFVDLPSSLLTLPTRTWREDLIWW